MTTSKKSKRVAPLVLELFSGGRILIDRTVCAGCMTQACVRRCVSSTLDPVLKIEGGVPVLARNDVSPQSGWCVECLACELDCALYGKHAVKIDFPQDRD